MISIISKGLPGWNDDLVNRLDCNKLRDSLYGYHNESETPPLLTPSQRIESELYLETYELLLKEADKIRKELTKEVSVVLQDEEKNLEVTVVASNDKDKVETNLLIRILNIWERVNHLIDMGRIVQEDLIIALTENHEYGELLHLPENEGEIPKELLDKLEDEFDIQLTREEIEEFLRFEKPLNAKDYLMQVISRDKEYSRLYKENNIRLLINSLLEDPKIDFSENLIEEFLDE